MTEEERRKIRIKNDYKWMLNIRGPVIQWEPVRGEPPFVIEYKLIVNVNSIMDSNRRMQNCHVMKVEIPAKYPLDPKAHPQIEIIEGKAPFHPNWWPNNTWCPGTWRTTESLAHTVLRMVQTLQFDPEISNPDSPANPAAATWWKANVRSGYFPCDRTPLPDPTKPRFTINNTPSPLTQKKKFNIQ